jgi:hypothetical protein
MPSPAYLLLALSLGPKVKIIKGIGIIATAMKPNVLRAHAGVRPMNTMMEVRAELKRRRKIAYFGELLLAATPHI